MGDISKLSGLRFFQMGKYEYKNMHECDFRDIPRPHYCMGLIIRGEGRFYFADECVLVRAGDIIFVPVGSTYISKWSGSPDILYISAHFSFEPPSPFPRSRKMKIQRLSVGELSQLERVFNEMYEGYDKEKRIQFSVLGKFYEVLSMVYPSLKYSRLDETDPRMDAAVEYIETHYRQDFSVDTLAKICNMSLPHFYACFKKTAGCSPIEYKHIVCIRHAELMLIDSEKRTVEDISESLGFSSAIYFREVFKKITGKTPREYRRMSIE